MPKRSLQPGLAFDGGQVVPQVFGCSASQAPTFTSNFWQRWGQLGSPNDQSFNIAVETEDIEIGSPMSAEDVLLMKLTGELNLLFADLHPYAFSKSLGTNVPIETTYNATWNSGTGTETVADTTESMLTLTTGEASGLQQNDILEISMSSGNNAYLQYGHVLRVEGDDVYLKYKLEAIPPVGATVKLVDSITIHHGGSDLEQQALLLQLDFPKGYQHKMIVYRAQANGGQTRQMSGHLKTPSKFRMLSNLKTISSKEYLVLASTQITMRNTAIAA